MYNKPGIKNYNFWRKTRIMKTKVGRPPKYDEDTKVVGFRIPISAEEEIKEIVNNFLVKLEK